MRVSNLLRGSAMLVLGMLSAGDIRGQGSWTLKTPALSPPPRHDHGMVHDSDRSMVVLYGGQGANQDTWEWDGTIWLPRVFGGSGLGLNWPLAYDAARKKTVYFRGTPQIPETHVWDGTNWQQLGPVNRPTRRWTGAMAYDAQRQKVVLFGGLNINQDGVLNDTWEWDGTDWAQRTVAVAPPGRMGHVMAYDPVQSVVVMYGGGPHPGAPSPSQVSYTDLWQFDGSQWIEQIAAGPTHTYGSAMAYDPSQQGMILFGGRDLSDPNSITQLSNRTWLLKNGSWTQLTTAQAPARRSGHAMVYDAARQRFLLSGGFNGSPMGDTWEFQPGIQGSYQTFGTGCPGSRGTPSLTTQFGAVPVSGRRFTVQVNNLPLTGLSWMFFGFSKTQYGPLTLPFNLNVIGMSGCTLFASGDLAFPVQNVLGVGLWSIDLPANFGGTTFYNQAIIQDPTANPLGLIVSDAGEALIGG